MYIYLYIKYSYMRLTKVSSLHMCHESYEKCIQIESLLPSTFENSIGMAPMKALTVSDGIAIDCWWLTILPTSR